MKYKVLIQRTTIQTFTVEVESDSENHAEQAAIKKLSEDDSMIDAEGELEDETDEVLECHEIEE